MSNKFNDFAYFSKPEALMRQVFTLFVAFYAFIFSAFGAIDSLYHEVIQRGYSIIGDSVEFPDGSRCLIIDFNTGNCGEQWKTADYCVPKGGMVWEKHRCCAGLDYYLPAGTDTQATCQPVTASFHHQFLVTGLVIAVLLLLYLFFLRKARKVKKKNRTRFAGNKWS